LAGTFLGAFSIVGKKQLPTFQTIVKGVAIVLFSTLVFSILSGFSAYVLGRCEIIQLPFIVHRQVGHPYRVLTSYGLDIGCVAGALIGGLIGGGYVFRKRAG